MRSLTLASLTRIPAVLVSSIAAVLLSTTTFAQQPVVRYAILPSSVASALAERSPTVTAERIQLPSVISSTLPAPSLHLLAADLRPDGNLSLRLACHTSAECLPFFAILSVDDRADALSLLSSLRGSPSPLAVLSPVAPSPRVSVGSRVRLQLSDLQMHIQIDGIAIDTAEAGHEVRIASLDRRHTYRGIVVDANTVKGDLP